MSPVMAWIVSAISLFLCVGILIKYIERKQAYQVLQKFAGQKIYGISSNVNFFGQESLGMLQARGKGILVLAEKELFFSMLAPKKEFSIPFEKMLGIETPKSYLGKTKGKALLQVNFENAEGKKDSMAWLVGKLSLWQQALDKIVQNKHKLKG